MGESQPLDPSVRQPRAPEAVVEHRDDTLDFRPGSIRWWRGDQLQRNVDDVNDKPCHESRRDAPKRSLGSFLLFTQLLRLDGSPPGHLTDQLPAFEVREKQDPEHRPHPCDGQARRRREIGKGEERYAEADDDCDDKRVPSLQPNEWGVSIWLRQESKGYPHLQKARR